MSVQNFPKRAKLATREDLLSAILQHTRRGLRIHHHELALSKLPQSRKLKWNLTTTPDSRVKRNGQILARLHRREYLARI